MTGRRGAATAAWWLPAVSAGAMVPVMFAVGMRSDPPEARAGAEPVVSGILFAAPFLWLFLFDAACGLWATLSESWGGRRIALVAMTVGSASVAGLLAWWWGLSAVRDGSLERGLFAVLLVLVVVVPVVPAGFALRRGAVPAEEPASWTTQPRPGAGRG